MTTQQTEVINQKLNGHYNKKINKAKDYNWSALYERIDLMTYLNPLLGHKEKIKDNQYLCHCPLGHNHSKSGYDPKTRTMHHSGQDTAPSLLIRERTDQELKAAEIAFEENPEKFRGKKPRRILYTCRGACSNAELSEWFHKEFKRLEVFSRIKIEIAKEKGHLKVVRNGFPHKDEPVKVPSKHEVFDVKLRGHIYDEYRELENTLGYIVMMLELGESREQIACELEDAIKSHRRRVDENRLEELQHKVLMTQSKSDLSRAYIKAQQALLDYHDAETNSYPFRNQELANRKPDEVRYHA